MELLVWMDQGDCLGVDLAVILDQQVRQAHEGSQVLLGPLERTALTVLLEKGVHLVLLEVLVCLD